MSKKVNKIKLGMWEGSGKGGGRADRKRCVEVAEATCALSLLSSVVLSFCVCFSFVLYYSRYHKDLKEDFCVFSGFLEILTLCVFFLQDFSRS